MSDLRDELYSLLVPLAGERLIVPRACVAEVIGYQAPSKDTNGTALPFHGTVPIYHGGAPVISEGVWNPTTSATQARGMISRPSTSGTSRL